MVSVQRKNRFRPACQYIYKRYPVTGDHVTNFFQYFFGLPGRLRSLCFYAERGGKERKNLQVGPRAGHFHGLAQPLQLAASVGHGARFLIGARRRQNHIGSLSRLMKEKILDNEKAFSAEVGRRAALERIRADDVESFETSGVSGGKHFRERKSGLAGRRYVPSQFAAFSRR